MTDSSPPTAALGSHVYQRTEKAVGEKRPDWPYVGLEHLETGSPDLVGTAPSSTSTSTNSIFHAGDVLFGKLRPYLRKSVGVSFSGYCSTDLMVLEPRSGNDPRFVAKLFQSAPVFAEAVATSIGTKMPRTSWSALQQFEVFAPRLPEQRRIAEILDTLDEAIRGTERVIAKLQQMKQGLLHDLLTRGIDDNGELRDPERHPEQFKDSPLGRIPNGWRVARLREALLKAPQNGLYKPASAIGRGVLMVGQTAFTPERSIDFTLARRAQATHGEVGNWGLREGDVLVARVFATVAGVGQPVLVPRVPEPAVYESNMMRLAVDTKQIRSALLFHWLRHPHARRHVVANANSSNQTSINQVGLGSVPLALPGLDEQAAMLGAVASTDSRLQQESYFVDKLRTLKHGLMDDLLTGRVRVSVPEGAAP